MIESKKISLYKNNNKIFIKKSFNQKFSSYLDFKREVNAYKLLKKFEFTPNLKKVDQNSKFILLERIPGQHPENLNHLTPFILEIFNSFYSLKLPSKKDKIYAKERYINILSFENNIKKRYIETTEINDNQLMKLLKLAKDNFLDFKNKNLESFEKITRIRMYCHSDISRKNIIIYKNKNYLIDFEYFGIDNPLKMIADLFLHPENKLRKRFEQTILKHLAYMFNIHEDKLFYDYFLIKQIYKLKWAFIIAKQFSKFDISYDYRKRLLNKIEKYAS